MTAGSPHLPDARFVRRRRISARRAEWARECDRIIGEHGAAGGTVAYRDRHQARWRARYLIELLVELGLRDRRELTEHTERHRGGWHWTVEWAGPPDDAKRSR